MIDFTRLHEQWNYDFVLVGYYASAAEGFAIALYAADHTERIKFLIAHRPGSVAPALAARQVATFDQLTQGRMALHIIAGTSDADQASEGDFLPKNDRYRRAGEYLDVMRKLWTSDSPIDHHGEFYRVEGGYSDIKPYQQPYPPLFFGGSSEGALEMGASIVTCSRSSASRSRRRGSGSRISAGAPRPSGATSASTCRCGRSWRIRGAAWDKANALLARRIFDAPPMGLEQVLLGLGMKERLAYDEVRNTLFINFEGFHVRTTDDVELVRREVERTCRAIGHKVHLVANYDGCDIDPMVADAYFSMITYMQNRYYATASRYTTSAFMRLKLGAGLTDRDVAPHVFETRREAQNELSNALTSPKHDAPISTRKRKKKLSAA